MTSAAKKTSRERRKVSVKAAPEDASTNGAVKFKLSAKAKEFIEKPTPDYGISLKDRVLLALKDGVERTADEVAKQLQEQIPAELAVEDPDAAKPRELKAGRQALLAQALQVLVTAERITLKGDQKDGGWNDAAKAKIVGSEPDERFEIDKEFKNLLPMQTPSEIAVLERQLLTQGCLDPLTVWEHGSRTLLVDGHTRHEICLRHGLKFEVRSVDLADRSAVVDWILAQHFGRRNLSLIAQSYYRGRRFNEFKLRGGDRKSEAKAQNAHLKKTAKILAEEFKVSRGTILRDGKFAEAVDKIIAAADRHGDDFRQKFLSRSLRLTVAAIKALAEKTKAEIGSLVGKLLKGDAVELAPGKASKVLRVTLPKGKPQEQAKVLFESLTPAQCAKLHEELGRLLGQKAEKEEPDTDEKEKKED